MIISPPQGMKDLELRTEPWEYNLIPQESPGSDHPRGSSLVKLGMILKVGASADWDGNTVESPCVWWDENKQQYGMIYVGYANDGSNNPITAQVGLAWSNDLLNWTKDPANPIFSPSGVGGAPDQYGTTGPVIWYENGVYYLFYIGLTASGYEAGTKTMCLATSTDLHTWTRYAGNPIISPSGAGWRQTAIYHANIVKVGGKYINFFNAADGSLVESIGYATSTDLYNWTVDDVNSPLLSGSGVANAWDQNRAGDPSVYKVGKTWYMAYYGTNTGGLAQDGLAYTTEQDFPLNWQRHPANPVLANGISGSYDYPYAHKPFIFQAPGKHYHFYVAASSASHTPGVRGIAVAIDELMTRKQFFTHRCNEGTTAQTFTSGPFLGVGQTTILFDPSEFLNLEMRILVRGMVTAGNSFTVRDKSLNNAASITITATTWANYASPWVPVSKSGLLSTNMEAAVTGGTGSWGNGQYEFRYKALTAN